MKAKLFAIILAALALAVMSGFSQGDGRAQEYYSGLLEGGVITAQEYELLERYDFELPESEQRPLDGFVIGEITTGALGDLVW